MFFNNYFNSATVIQKLHEQGLYGSNSFQSSQKYIPKIEQDKDINEVIIKLNTEMILHASNGWVTNCDASWKQY